MNFLSDVSTQEMAFLIFVLLFHDLKLPPKQKPLVCSRFPFALPPTD
jgi:hypothetical protein